jgi:hypothetical protein
LHWPKENVLCIRSPTAQCMMMGEMGSSLDSL